MRVRCARGKAREAGGFVLVGVIMFVLALTILGLSLFSLSGYEAHFLERSHSSAQALATAMGGLENAKFVLARRRLLQDVSSTLYPSGVIQARARRTDGVDPDTIASLDDIPANVPIELRVLADVNGQQRMIQTRVIPTSIPQVYKRLFTIRDSLHTLPNSTDGGGPACSGYRFLGEINEGGTPASWTSCVAPGYTLDSESIPLPAIASFFAAHLGDASTQDVTIADPLAPNITIDLFGTPGAPSFFRTIATPGDDGESSLHIPSTEDTQRIRVEGRVVWMLPRGVRIDGHTTVVPGPGSTGDDCLIIVAGKSDDDDSPGFGRFGIEFSAGLSSATVPVILVSDWWVFLEHFFYAGNSSIQNLNVFAKGASFWGSSTGFMALTGMNYRFDNSDPNGLINELTEAGALPNSDSGTTTFRTVAGTWQELDPANPPN